MQRMVAVVTKTAGKERHDDDFVDRLNHRYTVLIIVVFAIAVTTVQYIGKPITCWAPKHFTGSHIKYTTSYCWVRNTYYLPFSERIPPEGAPRQVIPYYQWIPFILLIQAFLFYVPSIVWNGLNQKSGVDADDILDTAQRLPQRQRGKKRLVKLIVGQFDRFLRGPRSNRQGQDCTINCKDLVSNTCCRCCAHHGGNYLVLLYLASKLLYIANIVAQLFILNVVLMTNYNKFGAQALEGFFTTGETEEHILGNTKTFPRVTLCDFRVRRLGNVQRYTVQCLLPINLYTEKVYIFLWFWMILVVMITGINFLTWLARAVFKSDRLTFIKNHLRYGEQLNDDEDKDLVEPFTTEYLKQDGVFLLRLIGHNSNGITVSEITVALWKAWRERRDEKPRLRKHSADLEAGQGGPDSPVHEDDEETKPLRKEAL